MVRSDRIGASASWALFRLGWYGGAGARRILGSTQPLSLGDQPACPPDPATGLVRCSWTSTFTVSVPPDAVSGLYVVRIVRADAFGALIPLVVKDERPADLLMESAVLTAQAYNNWGGTGLYDPPGAFAVQVSFDRPYASDTGSGQMLRYEALMARFLERYGYDVTYTTNLDVAHEGASTLLRRGAFLSIGHDEYWAGEQRDAVDAARDAGEPIFFFGANAAYWKVRLSSPGVDGNARVVGGDGVHGPERRGGLRRRQHLLAARRRRPAARRARRTDDCQYAEARAPASRSGGAFLRRRAPIGPAERKVGGFGPNRGRRHVRACRRRAAAGR